MEKTAGVILFAKYAKSRGMEGGRPDDGGRKIVRTGHRAKGLGVWCLENAHHSFPIGHEIAPDRLHPIELEALGLGGQPSNVLRGQRLGKLALENDVVHGRRISRAPCELEAQTKV